MAIQSSWMHNSLTSGGATPARISVDYQQQQTSDGQNFYTNASPLWLNVQADDFQPGDTVHAVWIDTPAFGANPFNMQQAVYESDLAYAGGTRFTGELPSTVLREASSNGTETRFSQQLSLERNGQWYTDPINSTHNFQLDLGATPWD